jgi:two-component system NtrC family response regulator
MLSIRLKGAIFAQGFQMKILAIDDDTVVVAYLAKYLKFKGHEFSQAFSASEGIVENKRILPQLVLVEIELGAKADLDLLAALVRDNPKASIVILTDHPSVQKAVDAMKYGATDYLQKPFLDAPVDLEKLKLVLAAHVLPEVVK